MLNRATSRSRLRAFQNVADSYHASIGISEMVRCRDYPERPMIGGLLSFEKTPNRILQETKGLPPIYHWLEAKPEIRTRAETILRLTCHHKAIAGGKLQQGI